MKKTKTCPKCAGSDIYSDEGMAKRGDRGSIAISSWTKFFIDVYICGDCGYMEEYISDNDLNDPKRREKLKQHWKKA